MSGILDFLYDTPLGRKILKILTSPAISKIGGVYMDSPISKIHIAGFIKNNAIDMSQYEKQDYHCFNDFFTRKVKAEERPFNMEKDILVSPSDGLLSA